MGATDETLALLRSIDASLKMLVSQARGATPPLVADDRDLDGAHGNPEIRAKDPRDWSGPPMKGRRFSECPADYLEMVAERFDYFAGKNDDPKKAAYERLDAARARGWAKRVREGKVPVGAGAGAGMSDASEWPEDGF